MSVPTIAPEPFCRTKLVELSGLVSSYPQTVKYQDRKDVGDIEQTDWAPKGLFMALVACQALVADAGGRLSVTEVGRKFALSAKARSEYLSGEKHAYVAPPGESMHNAGHAVDWWVYDLCFPGPQDTWLHTLWDIVIPQGFTPIIKQPSLKASECWHFDWRGPWQETYDWFKKNYPSKAYGMMARCAILDSGAWDFEYDTSHDGGWMQWAYIQAQLHRLGLHFVGVVDGIPGQKTKSALAMVSGASFFDDPEDIAGILNEVNTGKYKHA